MEVPRSLLDELTEDVNLLSGAAQEQASIALANIFAEWDGVDVEALRELCLAALEPLEERYTTLAAARGARFYEQNRRAQGVRGAYRAVVDSRRDPAAFEGAIRAMLRIIDQDRKATERYRREVLSRIDADMRRAANKCVAHNARRDPKKPKYARVPSGAETCGFCLMLSSFGFHYTTEEAAGHAHDGCDCRVVPSFGKASVKGYDAGGMYSRYQGVLDTLGGRDGIRAEWDALPREEREAYIASHGKKEGAAFQKYLNKRVSQEIETRDPKWFKTGEEPRVGFVSKEVEKRATKAEIGTAKRLAHHGVASTFIQDYRWVQEGGRKRKVGLPDLENGIEIKTIGTSGNAWGAMKNYLDSTAGKEGVKCMVVDNSASERISDEALIGAANELVAKYPKVAHARLLLKDGRYMAIK